jgi:hypothetical protein
MNDRTHILVGSSPDSEELYAEIYWDGEQWAHIVFDPKLSRYSITIFGRRSGEGLLLDLKDVEEAIGAAKGRLQQLGYP